MTAFSPVAAAVERSGTVTADDVRDARVEEDVGDRHARRADAGDDDLDVLDPLADDRERVEQRGEDDDRRAVLVVVEDGDVELVPQPLPRSRSSAAPRCPRG